MEEARKALDRHAWNEALTLLRQADATNGLDGEGLEMLADAAWWMAEPDESLAARERAYAAFVKAGEKRRAATEELARARRDRAEAVKLEGELRQALRAPRAEGAGMDRETERRARVWILRRELLRQGGEE